MCKDTTFTVQQDLDQMWTAATVPLAGRQSHLLTETHECRLPKTISLLHVDQRVERTTAAFEKAAVLFNMAAAMSADAAAADLASDAGCKRAARRYQVPQNALCSWLTQFTCRSAQVTVVNTPHLQTAAAAH